LPRRSYVTDATRRGDDGGGGGGDGFAANSIIAKYVYLIIVSLPANKISMFLSLPHCLTRTSRILDCSSS